MGQVAQLGRSLDQTLAFLVWLPSHVACLQTVPMSFSLRPQWGLNRQSLAGDLVGALATSPTGHSPVASCYYTLQVMSLARL